MDRPATGVRISMRRRRWVTAALVVVGLAILIGVLHDVLHPSPNAVLCAEMNGDCSGMTAPRRLVLP